MKLITNAKVLNNGELQESSILIDGKQVKQIAQNIEVDQDVEIKIGRAHV